jgi:hypothetical protein
MQFEKLGVIVLEAEKLVLAGRTPIAPVENQNEVGIGGNAREMNHLAVAVQEGKISGHVPRFQATRLVGNRRGSTAWGGEDQDKKEAQKNEEGSKRAGHESLSFTRIFRLKADGRITPRFDEYQCVIVKSNAKRFP